MSANSLPVGNDSNNIVIFDISKNERKLNEEYKSLQRKLKPKWKFIENTDVLTQEFLLTGKILILAGPENKFTELEMNSIRAFINSGGYVLVMLGEGGERKFNTNINYLLEEFGIMINNDCVVRINYHQTFHPKECTIRKGLSNKSIFVKNFENKELEFLYPYGATLNVVKPSLVAISSGTVTIPTNRPICAYYSSKSTSGKLVVLGSSKILTDMYIDKDSNDTLRDMIFGFFESDAIETNDIQSDDTDYWEYNFIPDITQQADKPRVCTQDTDSVDVPREYTKLFKHDLYDINLDMVPASLKAYEDLDVKHEPLSLIAPNFETPLPPTQLSVFPPSFQELPPPALELYDLDEAFSSNILKLSQLTNKYMSDANSSSEKELDYYIREFGAMMRINNIENLSAKNILNYVFQKISNYKKARN
ncbi:PREDICTED: intraflagellar transport protein 52 homolog [Ceratosolen solmsi marchali]|uniref:Intraflagellar transport protein 52 homolog n=1 Tax=Ceratosolen solmsi marchali TaxID=326594 RepID=A0AAJ6YK41_9HYME|nr:PREDICTED: intraflagellar transport protein 52 homolog [Ceratosolen solmsi marchali]